LRAREYDPATGQFLTVDPMVEQTGAVYTYAADNPLDESDLTGDCANASMAKVPSRAIPACQGHVVGTEGHSVFSVQTSGTPSLTWGFEFTATFLSELAAGGYDLTETTYTSDAYVNGKYVNGPGPKEGTAGYTYHGSIGPKIHGATKLKKGDIVVIEVWANGVAENAAGRTVSFEAHAHGLCRVE
jgi:hypothetical protein